MNKPVYGMRSAVGFMLKEALRSCRSVPVLSVVLAVTGALGSIARLLIGPAVVETVQSAASLPVLLGVIFSSAAVLLLISMLEKYVAANVLFGRVRIRIGILDKIAGKSASTSYPNLMSEKFLDLENRAANHTGSNGEATEHIWTVLTDLLRNMIGFAVYLLLLSGLHPLLAAAVLVTSALSWLVRQRINTWGYRHREEAAKYGKRMRYISEVESGRKFAKDIRIFTLQPWLDDVWNSACSLYRGFVTRREIRYLAADGTDLVLTLLRSGITYVWLTAMVIRGELSAAAFLLYISAADGFTQWVTGILSLFEQLHRECLDISTVMEFLFWPEPFFLQEGTPIPEDYSGPCEIRLEHVSFRYPGAAEDTLHDFSLTLAPGESVAVVGVNGAGKTTLVRLIAGFMDPSEGRVLLDGTDIRTFCRKDYMRLFAAVFQNFSVLDAGLDENVAQSTEGIDEEKVKRCLAQAGLLGKAMSLPHGLKEKIGRQVFEDGTDFSGGEMQRLMLARALYKGGRLLILDEPTAALDPIAENDIYQKYSRMTAGKTSLFISHRLASTRFCSRIILLDGGRIAETGTHEQLMKKNGLYAEMFRVQSRYYREGEMKNA